MGQGKTIDCLRGKARIQGRKLLADADGNGNRLAVSLFCCRGICLLWMFLSMFLLMSLRTGELPESPEPLFPHPARKLIHMEAARTAERTFFFISALLLMSLSECLCMLLYDYMNKNASTFYKYNSPGTVFSAFSCIADCSGALNIRIIPGLVPLGPT